MSEDVIKIEQTSNYVVLTLNRPDKLNSFNIEMHKALYVAMKAAVDDDNCRVILLTGVGRGFCAGQDLGDRDPSKMDSIDLGETLDHYYNPLVRLIRDAPKPILCAVNGVAAGAGANVALACDIVLAARSAKFIQAFCKIGIIPDSGGTWILPKLIGEARAKALALTGEPVSAEKAEQWGMIWRVFDDDNLMSEARKLMETFASGPTVGLGLTKQAIHASAMNDLSTHLDLERDFQRKAGTTPDFAEGVKAFLEKRPPEFTGQS